MLLCCDVGLGIKVLDSFGQMGGVFFSPSASGKLLREFLAAGFHGKLDPLFRLFLSSGVSGCETRRKRVDRSPNRPMGLVYLPTFMVNLSQM